MSSKQRYRSGPSAPVVAKRAGNSGIKFEIGDFVSVLGQYVVPASQSADTAVDAFQDTFLGVLVQGADDGSAKADEDVLVETQGEFEYDLNTPAIAPGNVGTLILPHTAGGFIVNQVVKVGLSTDQDTAIGHAAKPIKIGDTTVLVRITTRVMADAPLAV